jgi:hypothetical protein
MLAIVEALRSQSEADLRIWRAGFEDEIMDIQRQVKKY